MADIQGTPDFKDRVRQLQTTDPKHPDTWNPNYQVLINNDVYLKQKIEQVQDANSNLQLGWEAHQAKPGNWKPQIEHDTHGQLPWHRINGAPAGLNQGVVSDIRLGWGQYQGHREVAGFVAVAVGGKHGENSYFRSIQKLVNGQWLTVSVFW